MKMKNVCLQDKKLFRVVKKAAGYPPGIEMTFTADGAPFCQKNQMIRSVMRSEPNFLTKQPNGRSYL